MDSIRTTAPPARIQADRARRTISGMVVPWGTFATVSDGRRVAFAPGSLELSDRAKLVLDHDPTQPVAVYASSEATDYGLEATFRVPAGDRGDAVLADASEGLRDGFSVAADLGAFDETDQGIWVTAAKGRHVALLSEPAYDAARVAKVTASSSRTEPVPMQPQPDPTNHPAASSIPAPGSTSSAPPATPAMPPAAAAAPSTPGPAGPGGALEPGAVLTLAGAAPTPVAATAPARVEDPYPYALALEFGGPSFVRDAFDAMENPTTAGAERWRRAQAQAQDPAFIRAGMVHVARLNPRAPHVQAAGEGTTTGLSELVPPRWHPERYVAIKAIKAPLWSVLAKYPTPDFTTIMVPRTSDESGLSGRPPDEVTPIAPGTIDTDADTVTIDEVEGAYRFSRKLLLGSNPQIDRIALDAMERAWLNDVEDAAVAFFTAPAHHTAAAGTYADGAGFVDAVKHELAVMATGPYIGTDVVPAAAEYQAAAEAKDTTGRALLPWSDSINSSGESEDAFRALVIQGVPLWPGRSMTADKTLVIDSNVDAAVAWTTPVMNFRLEWTTDATTGGNVRVLKLVKYSGVGLWAQRPDAILCITNTTPIGAAGGTRAGERSSAASAKK